ncbi:MAG: hypothetical protein NTX39_10140 [Opitutae bacterium]|nr:hypothetical protein [Opitutae bacterium]
MKSRPLSLLLAVAAWSSVASTMPAANPEESTGTLKPAADRYALTQSHISLLLAQRLQPTPEPRDLFNPFEENNPTELIAPANAESAPVAPATIVPPAPDAGEAEILAHHAANLKISGVALINNRLHLAINQILYKTGDMVPVGTKEEPLSLQILNITSDELTLGLNQTEQIISLKKLAPGK